MTRTNAFVDEWDVRAPIEAVFDALSDPERYPLWWKPVYLAARLVAAIQVDLSCGTRTSSSTCSRDGFRTDYVGLRNGSERAAHKDRGCGSRRSLRRRHLDPQRGADARPWSTLPLGNHNWAIKRAMEGLEPYARRLAGLPN
jgi:hypothetical protein